MDHPGQRRGRARIHRRSARWSWIVRRPRPGKASSWPCSELRLRRIEAKKPGAVVLTQQRQAPNSVLFIEIVRAEIEVIHQNVLDTARPQFLDRGAPESQLLPAIGFLRRIG